MICPDCEGTGESFGIGCGPGGCRPMAMGCSRCDGSGKVSAKMTEWMEIGRETKELRWKHDLSQREFAKRLGMPVSEYSRMEHGYVDPASVLKLIEKSGLLIKP